MPIPPLDSTAQAIFQEILCEPEDDTPRLAYADRLMELGDEERACPKCKGDPCNVPWFGHGAKCQECGGAGRIIDRTNTLHAELIRKMIENGNEMALGMGISIWVGRLAPALPGVAFTVRRGFVDEIACTLERFTELFTREDVHGNVIDAKHFDHRVMRERFPWPLCRIRLTNCEPSQTNPPKYWIWERNQFPEYLYKLLFPDETNSPRNPVYSGWRTKSASHAALSSACLSWFRSVCGIKEVR
jgi:uncharacterized protein (TIGR02996 family)